ncbi:MAG: metallophosphoesterase [Halomonadaceae bacterium]|nr:metallophosphoesterase [Halomonadaceae bacterium]
MANQDADAVLPRYKGKKCWMPEGLPSTAEPWRLGGERAAGKAHRQRSDFSAVMNRAASLSPLKWPKRPVYFVSDPHADAAAFSASLVASGGVKKTGPEHDAFALTKPGRQGLFVIGGDCLDKGPSNLDLLRSVKALFDTGARVKLLAGNHDVRLLMGLRALEEPRSPETEHLFVRMGSKVVPLLREIHDTYLKARTKPLKGIPSAEECRRRLFPSDNWFETFPPQAGRLMSQRNIERELSRMRKKVDTFEDACQKAGLSMREVYATALEAKAQFMHRKGDFAWFFRAMQLAHREGSFLFIHAGLDDGITEVIELESVKSLNRMFDDQIKHDLFEFYYGTLANTMRTKYRKVDLPLTRQGVDRAFRQGVHAVVHGHINHTTGQHIMLRQGMMHIEGDITLDRNSRRKEGLEGHGVGVTIIHPDGKVIGISNDHPHAKVFEPARHLSPADALSF